MPGVKEDPSVADRGSATMVNVTAQSPNGDYSDQELQRLVSHFEVSRAELKNVGHSWTSVPYPILLPTSVSILCWLNRFSKRNREIQRHPNYSKVQSTFGHNVSDGDPHSR